MKNVQTSIKGGHIDEAIAACDKQQGSVANAIRAALVKYQDVKKEGFNSEEAAETIHKEIEEATSLRNANVRTTHDYSFYFSFFRNSCRIIRNSNRYD
jgi:hypothetical protein